jgi:hypothetical protein
LGAADGAEGLVCAIAGYAVVAGVGPDGIVGEFAVGGGDAGVIEPYEVFAGRSCCSAFRLGGEGAVGGEGESDEEGSKDKEGGYFCHC